MPTQSVKEITLETLVGPLAETFPQLIRGTILHSDALTTERRLNSKLRNQWFYTADSNVYTIEDDEAVWYLGREPTNPIFNNIEEATQQLIRTGDYILPNEKRGEINAVIKAEDTLRVRLSDLRLLGGGGVFLYFGIDTANYGKLNPEQRRVAERIYGQGDDFVGNMEMFNESGITKTRVYVLNPDYVKRNVPEDGGLARASRFVLFGFDSRFYAVSWFVDFHFGLRGARNVADNK